MRAEEFEVLRQHMLVEISAGIFHLRNSIGKAALDERVLTAMGKVSRHEFVPIELQQYAYANISATDWLRQDNFPAVYCCIDDRST